jgi:hypothetical protein
MKKTVKKNQPKPLRQPKTDVEALSMGMAATAERNTMLPDRFVLKEADAPNAKIIVDTATGREVRVGLCDYSGARKVLAALFAGQGLQTRRVAAWVDADKDGVWNDDDVRLDREIAVDNARSHGGRLFALVLQVADVVEEKDNL